MSSSSKDGQNYTQLFDAFVVVQIARDQNPQEPLAPLVTHIYSPLMRPCGTYSAHDAYDDLPHDLASLCLPNSANLVRAHAQSFDGIDHSFVLTKSNGDRTYGFCRNFTPMNAGSRYPIVLCFISSYNAQYLFNMMLKLLHVRWSILPAYAFEMVYALGGAPPESFMHLHTAHASMAIDVDSEYRSLNEWRETKNKLHIPDILSVRLLPYEVHNIQLKFMSNKPIHKDEVKTHQAQYPNNVPRTPICNRYIFGVDDIHSANSLTTASLHLLFQHQSPDNLIRLFTSILSEKRIVMVAKDVNVLTQCTLAAVDMIKPFVWRHLFVPLLPETLVGFIAAPVPFIFGVPANSLESVQEQHVDQIIVVDLDTDTVSLIGTFELDAQFTFPFPAYLGEKTLREQKKLNRATATNIQIAEIFLSFILVLLSAGRWGDLLQQGQQSLSDMENNTTSYKQNVQAFIPAHEPKAKELHDYFNQICGTDQVHSFFTAQKDRFIKYFQLLKCQNRVWGSNLQKSPPPMLNYIANTLITSASGSQPTEIVKITSPHSVDMGDGYGVIAFPAEHIKSTSIATTPFTSPEFTRSASTMTSPSKASKMLEVATKKAAFEAIFTVPEKILAEFLADKNWPCVASYTSTVKRLKTITNTQNASTPLHEATENTKKALLIYLTGGTDMLDVNKMSVQLTGPEMGLNNVLVSGNILVPLEDDVHMGSTNSYITAIDAAHMLGGDLLLKQVQVLTLLTFDARLLPVMAPIIISKLEESNYKQWRVIALALILIDVLLTRGNELVIAYFGTSQVLGMLKDQTIFSFKEPKPQLCVRIFANRVYIHLSSIYQLKQARYINSGIDQVFFSCHTKAIASTPSLKEKSVGGRPSIVFADILQLNMDNTPVAPAVHNPHTRVLQQLQSSKELHLPTHKEQSLHHQTRQLIPSFYSFHKAMQLRNPTAVHNTDISHTNLTQTEYKIMQSIFKQNDADPNAINHDEFRAVPQMRRLTVTGELSLIE